MITSTVWYNPNEIKFLLPNLVAFGFFRLSFVNLQRAKDGTHKFDVKYRYMSVV